MEDYQRVAKAIRYIYENLHEQPQLEEIAETIHVSPYHFQRMFTQWSGVSPKKFLQYLSAKFAKQLMKGGNYSNLEVAYATGLSGTGRLHDLFVNLEAMSPGAFKNAGEGLTIYYGIFETLFGKVLIASTALGICHLHFIQEEEQALHDLRLEWLNAELIEDKPFNALYIHQIFNNEDQQKPINLHVKGSSFQLKVWEALLKIPEGQMASYGQIAQIIGQPNASRAVGTAIGQNPVAKLIPCHRVIKKVGGIGEYRWGSERKMALLTWEQCKHLSFNNFAVS